MREWLRQWQRQVKAHKRRVVRAILLPIFLLVVGWLWRLPERQLQAESGRLAHNERLSLDQPHRDSIARDIGTLAAVASGLFLVLSSCSLSKNKKESVDFSGLNLNGADFNNANLSGANLSGTELRYADLSGADFSGANLNGANLSCANLNGADLSSTTLRYTNLSCADLRYTNLNNADLRCADLSNANLSCALVRNANFSDANLGGTLLFFINSQAALNLEPIQLNAKPSPFLCHVALPAYAQQPVNPNRDCKQIPQLLSERYNISIDEAQEIVYEALQHSWNYKHK